MATVNSAYLDADLISQLKAHYLMNGSVSLQKFFSPSAFKKILAKAATLSHKESFEPLSHHYQRAALNTAVLDVLGHDEVLLYLGAITGRRYGSIHCESIVLSHKSYELRSDIESKGTDIILTLSAGFSEEVGGAVMYADRDGNTQTIPFAANTLSIIAKGEETDRFITYVNHHAKKKTSLLIRGRIA